MLDRQLAVLLVVLAHLAEDAEATLGLLRDELLVLIREDVELDAGVEELVVVQRLTIILSLDLLLVGIDLLMLGLDVGHDLRVNRVLLRAQVEVGEGHLRQRRQNMTRATEVVAVVERIDLGRAGDVALGGVLGVLHCWSLSGAAHFIRLFGVGKPCLGNPLDRHPRLDTLNPKFQLPLPKDGKDSTRSTD